MVGLLACVAVSVHGCQYAAHGRHLPTGHPEINKAEVAPDAWAPDEAGGRFHTPEGGITVPNPAYGSNTTTADLIDELAKTSVAAGTGPLCYWSWQSLPPPPDLLHNFNWGSRGHFNFDAMEKEHPGSVVAIRDLCTYAVDRLQRHVDPLGRKGVVVLGAVTEGTEFASFLCDKGLHLDRAAHPERCTAPLYNQSWGLRWPMSVTMWKFDGTNKEEVTKTMRAWRSEPSQHLPNILSPGPSPPPPSPAPVPIPGPLPGPPVPDGGGSYPHAGTHWGVGGGVVGKVLPCDAIPATFRYQPPFPQDTSPVGYVSPAGKTFLDDALQYWSTTPGVPLPAPPKKAVESFEEHA